MDYFLARLPVFSGLPEPVLAELSRKLALRAYRKGETLFEEGGAAEAVYVLRAGLVKAVKYSPRSGRASVELIAPGQIFGMIAVLDGKPYPVGTIALKKSEAYRMSASVFLSLMGAYPAFSKRIHAAIGEHVRQAQFLHSLSAEPVERRIAHILGFLYASIGKEITVRREEIAELAGCTVETAIRTLAAFKKRGWISSGWKRITVLKPAALGWVPGLGAWGWVPGTHES